MTLNASRTLYCSIHKVEQPLAGNYTCCYECGHVYPTARSLRRAYRRRARRVYGKGMWRWRIQAMFCRARDISFCQECIRDFWFQPRDQEEAS